MILKRHHVLRALNAKDFLNKSRSRRSIIPVYQIEYNRIAKEQLTCTRCVNSTSALATIYLVNTWSILDQQCNQHQKHGAHKLRVLVGRLSCIGNYFLKLLPMHSYYSRRKTGKNYTPGIRLLSTPIPAIILSRLLNACFEQTLLVKIVRKFSRRKLLSMWF